MFRKHLSKAAAILVSMSILAGCGSNNNSGNNGSSNTGATAGDTPAQSTDGSEESSDIEFGKLTLIMFGDQSSRMQQLMANEFKDIFLEEINTEIELQYIPWGEYGAGNKIDLMIAAGEDFDGARTHADWAAQSVSKGYLKDLTDVAETYLPDLKKVVPKEAFESLTFNGNLYAIPMGNKPSAGHFGSIAVRQDIMEEVGMTDITSLEDLDKFYTLGKEAHPEMYATPDRDIPFYFLFGSSERNLVATEFAGLFFNEDTAKFEAIVDTEEFKTICEYREKWYKEGLTPTDLLTNQAGNTAMFESGNYLSFRGSSGTTVVENLPNLKLAVPEADLKEYWMNPDKTRYKSMYTDYAWQVPAYSKNAERLAMFVNLIQKNTEYVDMFTYGILDTDYEIVDNKIHRLQNDELFYQWAMFNTNISTFEEAYPSDFIEVYKHWDDGSVKSKLVGFALDTESIRNEAAKVSAVQEEYYSIMATGFISYEENIDKYRTELENAGFYTYLEEVQRQFDEYIAAQ